MEGRHAGPEPDARLALASRIEDAERRGRPRGLARVGLFLGGTLAGGVGGGMLALAVGAGGYALGMLAGAVGAVAVEVRRACLLAARAAAFDTPRAQRLIERIRAKIPEGPVAARRASAWVVHGTGSPEPEVMSRGEYEAFAATAPELSEIRLDGRGVVLARLRDGKLHTMADGGPALERYDLSTGLVEDRRWYVGGLEVSSEAAAIYRDAIRREGPSRDSDEAPRQ